MNDNRKDWETMTGLLPENAPLATPYVPYQRENPARYDARKGIIRGTIFPGLDLPFMGLVNTQELPQTPLSELQILGFAIQDLALYLDTHRDDKDALELYRSYQEIYHRGMMEYTQHHIPLDHDIPGDGKTYEWLSDPWPWEYMGK